jgi:hypothetical protein
VFLHNCRHMEEVLASDVQVEGDVSDERDAQMDSEAGGPCDGMYVASCPATCNTCNGACTTTETTASTS